MVIIRTLTLLRLIKTLVMTIMRTLTLLRIEKEVGRDDREEVDAREIRIPIDSILGGEKIFFVIFLFGRESAICSQEKSLSFEAESRVGVKQLLANW